MWPILCNISLLQIMPRFVAHHGALSVDLVYGHFPSNYVSMYSNMGMCVYNCAVL